MASGTVFIWDEAFVRDAWPDCDKLFEHLPAVYHHALGIRWYWVAYESTEGATWDEPIQPDDLELSHRLADFITWLKWATWATPFEGNAKWEVWT